MKIPFSRGDAEFAESQDSLRLRSGNRPSTPLGVQSGVEGCTQSEVEGNRFYVLLLPQNQLIFNLILTQYLSVPFIPLSPPRSPRLRVQHSVV